MTTLYREVLIKSAEQAAALPAGTPVLIEVDGGASEVHLIEDLYPEHVESTRHVTCKALVPVEAEEEQIALASRAENAAAVMLTAVAAVREAMNPKETTR